MRIIKKSIFVLFLGLLITCTAGIFIACDKGDTNANDGNSSSSHSHSYSTQVVSPTCTNKGYTIHICTCGENYKDDYENALGHSFTTYIFNNDATYENDGTETATCDHNGCNAKDTRIDVGSMFSHTHNYSTKVTPPTCTEQGYTTYTCSCGDTYKAEYENELGHSYTNYTYDGNATYESDGTKTAYCDNGCGNKNTLIEIGSKLNHNSISFRNLEVEQNNTVSLKVASGTSEYLLSTLIETTGEAIYGVYTHSSCNADYYIRSTLVNLVTGDNIFYILAENTDLGDVLYILKIRVKPTYMVQFDSLGGSTVSTQMVEEDSFASIPVAPYKEGYTFNGWDFDFEHTPITNNKIITANAWKVNEYTVFFEGNGATNPNNKIVSYGSIYGELPIVERKGYIFIGWFTESGTSIQIMEDSIVSTSNDHTLYAKWSSIIIYELSDDGKGYNVAGLNDKNQTEIKIEAEYEGLPVTHINDFAFHFCSDLTRIEIPNSIVSIGKAAFTNCNSLTNIEIPNSVEYIGESAFRLCFRLESVHIPDSVISVQDYAFAECGGLVNVIIGNGLDTINPKTFYSCGSLKDITIGNGITTISESAFESCSKITNINVGENNTAYSSQNGILYNKNKTFLILYPSQKTENTFIVPNNVTKIGDKAFANCVNLTEINLSCEVESIGRYAFSECCSLKQIAIPNNTTSIGSYAFYKCNSLEMVEFGNKLSSIGYYSFYGCSKLTSVIIPDETTYIDNYAFYQCSGLKTIKLGNKLNSIGSYAFYGCNQLTSIVIPNSVNSIGNSAFAECTLLEDVIIGDSTTSIGASAFAECVSLTNIVIGESVNSIGRHVFSNCNKLNSIVIPKSVTLIEGPLFFSCFHVTIYCEAVSKPKGWSSDWNDYDLPVVWGYTEN